MFQILAETWNREVVGALRKRIPFRVKEIGGRNWRHPFYHTLRHDGENWLYQVKPGFVNEDSLTASTFGKYISPKAIMKHSVQSLEDPVSLPLIDRPEMRIPETRIIGSGALPAASSVSPAGEITQSFEPVPEFFKNLGVRDSKASLESSLQFGFVELVNEQEAGTRILRAFDTWIRTPRLQTSVDWQFGTVLEATLATFTINYKIPTETQSLLMDGPEFVQVAVPSEIDLLSGLVEDKQHDETKLATVYFVSPPDADPKDELDETWQPYLAHDIFFNLSHRLKNVPQPTDTEPNTLVTGLAGGIADPIIGGLLAQNNDLLSNAAQIYRLRSTGGAFWSV
ncbi:MAG: hypothetical protein GY872_07485 [Roseibacillus sp.]|nr:hypothetical protein [Myxococcales bacterium]MCP4729904.1 hypothetical protein [Roseibacillus sp.]